ncbi:MAG: hypothetical protein JOZ55_11150, partial [Alphaproteobacteria bacterium]|nr:hypothetical protein [Alphaproteobacteria bacterium]
EQLAYAMKPFAQVKSAYSRGHDGTGLGLPLAKALVEQHGGIMAVSSEPDVGTRVVIALPNDKRSPTSPVPPEGENRISQKESSP